MVEREHRGRVIYAGGDDVLAMVPVADLLSVMPRLRETYSGSAASDECTDWQQTRHAQKLVCKDGFVLLPGRSGQPRRLLRMMGAGATASCGAVVAHHQTPLGIALRELRETEGRAKKEGGRNAFSITVLKRSGGTLRFTGKWGRAIAVISQLRKFLADPDLSRRAAYNSLAWLRDLPDDADKEMLGSLLAYQFERQTGRRTARDAHDVPGLARHLAELATARSPGLPSVREWLADFLGIAEFLAREVRSQSASDGDARSRPPHPAPPEGTLPKASGEATA